MLHKLALAPLISLVLLAACTSVAEQTRSQPDLSVRLSDPGLTRVYVFNGLGQVLKSTHVHVDEGGIDCGSISHGYYLAWERPPGTHLMRARAKFKVEGTFGAQSEALLNLTPGPGDVQYVLLELQTTPEKLIVRMLDEREGQSLLERYEPADYQR